MTVTDDEKEQRETYAVLKDALDIDGEKEKQFQFTFNRLFHRLWTKAVGQEGYQKSEWNELVEMLREKGIHV